MNLTATDLLNATDADLARYTGDPWPWQTRDLARKEQDRRSYLAKMAALEPGDGVHYTVGTDRYSATVVSITPSRHRIVVQDDEARQTGDYFGAQRWDCTPNPDGPLRTFTRRASGIYRERGCDHGILRAGRDHYQDPHL